MFFPFTNYKAVPFNTDSGAAILYTTTAKSIIAVDFDDITVGGDDAGVSVFNYSAKNLELILFHTVGGVNTTEHAVVESGLQVKRSSVTTSNTRITGTLHIFELP
tara:strand:- start:5712 stop:6026 length:315 start_codon:yes stop_codon:yes gene_type:complete